MFEPGVPPARFHRAESRRPEALLQHYIKSKLVFVNLYLFVICNLVIFVIYL